MQQVMPPTQNNLNIAQSNQMISMVQVDPAQTATNNDNQVAVAEKTTLENLHADTANNTPLNHHQLQ